MAGADKKPNTARGIRSPVSPVELSGRITLPDGRGSEALLVWNVSDSGLGIWVSEALSSGTLIDIELKRPQIVRLRAEVRWCRALPSQPGYLVGLAVSDQAEELSAIHAVIKTASRSIKAS